MSSTVNKILKNTLYMYSGTILTMFVSLYSTRLILNSLGVSDFGIFAIVGGAIGMLGFLNGSMSSATQRFINYAQGEGDIKGIVQIFNSAFVIHLVLSVVVLFVLEIAFFVYFNGVLNIPSDRVVAAQWIYQLMVVSAILSILSVPYTANINAHEDMGYLSLLGIVLCFAKLLVALCLSISPIDKLIFYGFFMALIQWIDMAVKVIYCKKHYAECTLSLKRQSNRKTIKEMYTFASFNLMTTMTSMASVYGGNLLVNNFFGTVVNAAQGVASQISGQLMVFSVSLKSAINPVIGKKAGANDMASLLKYSFTTSKLSFFLLTFFAVVFIIETPWILEMWLKQVPDWAVTFCRFEIVRNLLLQLMEGPRSALLSEGRIRVFSIYQSVLYILPLPVVYFCFLMGGTPIFLYIIMILFLNVIASGTIVYFVKRNCGMSIRLFCEDVLLRGLSSFSIIFCASIIPIFFMDSSLIRVIFVFLISVVSFIFVFYFIGMNKIERALIVRTSKMILEKVFHKNASNG